MRRFFCILLLLASSVWAGPQDASAFDPSGLGAQNAVYQFNYEKPQDLLLGLGYLKNHLQALKEFGDLGHSQLVVVAHGNELHMLSRLNQVAYPEIYAELKQLTNQGVQFRVCRNAARSRGYQPQDFYDVVTVVPSAMSELAKWQGQGFAYISGNVIRKTQRPRPDLAPALPAN
ncbi:DsrE/DsrF-like family protein [mine drainage metagenome]|uniref:DsrE/DsrF-like family protein n=1 Tax=mine drainage metagenome TaxID=410659 RepID=A0A1J5PCN7_9ZZZZ